MKLDIFSVLRELRNRKIYFELASYRDDYIMVIVSVPGERWEIECTVSGSMEIEVFRSDGKILEVTALGDLFERFSD